MKRSQVSLFIIVGIVVLVGLVLVLSLSRNRAGVSLESGTKRVAESGFKDTFQNYFDICSRDAVIAAAEEIGIHPATNAEFESYVRAKVEHCTSLMHPEAEKQGYTVQDSPIDISVEHHELVIYASISYNVYFTKNQNRYEFDDYTMAFSKRNSIDFSSAEFRDVILHSPDNNVKITVFKGTTAQAGGQSVDSIGLLMLERNFDGLKNSVVAGNLIYEGTPDGAKFSKPVQIEIDVRNKDYPLDNPESLRIAWWDAKSNIWRGLKTTYNNGRVTAMLDHFTKFAVVVNCGGGLSEIEIDTPYLYLQKFTLHNPPVDIKGVMGPGYSDYYSMNLDFCMNQWEVDDKDSVVIPKLGPYLGIRNGANPRIHLTKEGISDDSFLAGAVFSYGTGSECESLPSLTPYCCCDSDYNGPDDPGADHEPNCYGSSITKQECMYVYGENYHLHRHYKKNETPKECEGLNYDGKVLPNTVPGYKFVGYNSMDCIGGKSKGRPIITAGGISYDALLVIEFHNDGTSCLEDEGVSPEGPVEVTPIYNGAEGGCTVNWNKAAVESEQKNTNGYAYSVIVSDTVSPTPSSGYCSTCKAKIKVHGTGMSGYSMYEVCDPEQSPYGLYFDNGKYVCGECKMNEIIGKNVLMGPVDNSLCLCTMPDAVYCKGVIDGNYWACIEQPDGTLQLVQNSDWDTTLCDCCNAETQAQRPECEMVSCEYQGQFDNYYGDEE